MSRSRKTSSALIPVLLVAGAVAIWTVDAYRQSDSGQSGRTPEEWREQASPAPTLNPTPSGGYETSKGCILAKDRTNDGDSFRVKLPGGRTEIIRLYFVDCPESAFRTYGGDRNNHGRINDQAREMGRITSRQAVGIGRKAKDFTLHHLGKAPFSLYTKWDSPFNDKRYHGFIELTYGGEERFLHELLVEKGFARIHTKGAPSPNGTSERKQEDHLFDLQRAAKSRKSGAWGL